MRPYRGLPRPKTWGGPAWIKSYNITLRYNLMEFFAGWVGLCAGPVRAAAVANDPGI